LSAIWNNIKDAASRIWENLKDAVRNIVDGLVDAVVKLWEGFKDTLSTIMNGIKDTASEVWENIKTSISDLAQGAKDAAVEARETLKEKTSEAFNKVVDFITEPLEDIDLFQIGKDIIQGLIDGVGSMASAVWDKATSIAEGIGGAIKSALGIASPSRLMIQFGKWTGEGLAQGIDKTADMVGRASDGLAEAATPDIDMTYDTPNGFERSLAGAVRGTVDVNTRDRALVNAIGSLESRLANLEVVMDGRVVGKIVEPHVSEARERKLTRRDRARGY